MAAPPRKWVQTRDEGIEQRGGGHSLNNAPEKRGMVVAQRGAVCAEEEEAKLISLSGGGPREIAAAAGE